MTTLDMARRASDYFGQAGHDPVKELPEAIIFGFEGEDIFVITCGKDIYNAIESAHDSPIAAVDYKGGYSAVGAFTSGWAAPIAEGQSEPDTLPSEHPERRRVTLISVYTTKNSANIIRFEDGTEFTDEDGEGRGALAEAMFTLAAAICD